MGRTMTLDEVKERSVTELLQEAAQTNGPLIVTLDDGTAVALTQYQPEIQSAEQELVLEPLPQLEGSIPAGWKDAIYGEDGSGRA